MNIKELTEKTALAAPPSQEQLFRVEKQIERDGVEMGVLENGVPYLSETGLARMCGVARRSIRDLAADWNNEKTKPRGQRIQEKLIELGYTEPNLFVKATDSGVAVNAYTEPVCLANLSTTLLTHPLRKRKLRTRFGLSRRLRLGHISMPLLDTAQKQKFWRGGSITTTALT